MLLLRLQFASHPRSRRLDLARLVHFGSSCPFPQSNESALNVVPTRRTTMRNFQTHFWVVMDSRKPGKMICPSYFDATAGRGGEGTVCYFCAPFGRQLVGDQSRIAHLNQVR